MRDRFRISAVTIAHRTIGFEQIGAGPAMRNDLAKKGRDRDHRALGLEPEAAQGLEMLDCPIGPSLEASPCTRNNSTSRIP
jgi:hypothetical protein